MVEIKDNQSIKEQNLCSTDEQLTVTEELPCGTVAPEDNLAAATEADETSKQILALQQELEEEHRRLLSTLADMANLRKRTEKEIFNARKYALESFAKDIIETVDNLERSLAASNQQPAELKEFYTGIELTLKSLKETLARYDVKEINPLNQPFDHQLHTAIATQPAPAGQEIMANTVISVVQKGYQLKDRLIRPAMVVVAQ